ncbi:hypothetical protein [uncultured Methylovirgula sp.]|uniref:hypothetical protein n=1 Tax=uncultured Methylovirgula sp. TaxID=1285960 RepID=UPI0026326C72|nr:hypothetical protein [uncultured Methylovirgula sp.]
MPVTLVLTFANGTKAQFVLKAANSSPANAPYDDRSCDILERKVQIMNEHQSNAAIEAIATDRVMMQALKT